MHGTASLTAMHSKPRKHALRHGAEVLYVLSDMTVAQEGSGEIKAKSQKQEHIRASTESVLLAQASLLHLGSPRSAYDQ